MYRQAAKVGRIHSRPPKAEDLEALIGRWKITAVLYDEPEDVQPVPVCESGLIGVEVILDDQCDVTWVVPAGVEPIPLLQTTGFIGERGGIDLVGGPDGKEFNFALHWVGGSEDELDLSRELPVGGTVTIKFSRVKDAIAGTDLQGFSLKDALDEGFFSDLTVRSTDDQTFPCHRAVLTSCCPEVSYREWEVFLSSLRTPVLKAGLSYVYSSQLPADLEVPLAKELFSAASANPKLSALSEVCKFYIDNHTLKLRLVQLVDGIQSGLEAGKKLVDSTDMTNPAKVSYAVKQLAKEAASIVSKFCLLCELYSRNKGDMSKAEKQEVLEYLRGRVVVFIDQGKELLELVMVKYTSLTELQRQELAQYILPEVERIWDILLTSCKDIQAALSSKVDGLAPVGPLAGIKRGDISFALLLQLVTKAKEITRMQKMAKEFEKFVLVAEQKREAWRDAGEDEKTQKVLRAIERLLGEGESQVENLEDIKREILMKNALEWKKFKMLVALSCSSMSWGLRKVLSLKAPLKPVLMRACKFLHSQDVIQTLAYFGVLEEEDLATLNEEHEDLVTSPAALPWREYKCLSVADESPLGKGCQKLLESHEFSDMQFVLPTSDPEEEEVVFPAHRVVVAARCEWFKKALLSGMREAIDRRIVLQDVDPGAFHVFLQYLYGNSLKLNSFQVEELLDLLSIADRFEAPTLCSLCETQLVSRLASSNVFLLLQVADRYSSRKLREAALQHILESPEVIMSEIEAYSGIAEELRQEIRTLLSATHDPTLLLRHQYTPPSPPTELPDPAHSPDRSSHGDSSSGEEDEEYLLDEATVVFDKAVVELRAVIGSEAPEELLKDLLLAADCDVNRALNFYFNTLQ